MRKRRSLQHLDTSTFADVSFLLLIFFMVVTSFNREYVMKMTVPPSDEKPVKQGVDQNRLMQLYFDENGRVLFKERSYTSLSEVLLAEEIISITKSPKHGIIQLHLPENMSFDTYTQIHNHIKMEKVRAKEVLLSFLTGEEDADQDNPEVANDMDARLDFRISEIYKK